MRRRRGGWSDSGTTEVATGRGADGTALLFLKIQSGFSIFLIMVGIIDYNAGNITSVERSLKKLGIEYVMSKKPEELEKCSHLIFPGDGDDAYAMKELDNLGFTDFIKRKVSEGVLLLGICVGSQIIFSYSDEGNINCLNM